MKIFLDDTRVPIFNSWTSATNSLEFMALLVENFPDIEEISFDHDLGDMSPGDGIACVDLLINWIVDHPETQLNLKKIIVHSANPVGAKNIADRVTSAIKYFYRLENVVLEIRPVTSVKGFYRERGELVNFQKLGIAPQDSHRTCKQDVDITSLWQKEYREQMFLKKSEKYAMLDHPFQCTHAATHRVQGIPMCARHAGQIALDIATEMTILAGTQS